jgi:hypothetical protein
VSAGKPAKARRAPVRAEEPKEVVIEEDNEPEESFMSKNKEAIALLAPVAGAAAGGALIEVVSKKFEIRRELLALIAGGAGVVTAASTKGPTRDLALGVGAAGLCIGLIDFMAKFDFFYAAPPKKAPEATRQAAPPPEGVTPEQMQKAIDENAAKMTAEKNELVEKVRNAYESQIAQMQQTYQNQLAEQNQTIGKLMREVRRMERSRRPRRPDAQPPVEQQPLAMVPETPFEETVSEGAQPVAMAQEVAAEQEVVPSEVEQSVAAPSKLDEVFALLTEDEAARLREMIERLPPEALAKAEAYLDRLPIDEAAEYLRTNLLTNREAA